MKVVDEDLLDMYMMRFWATVHCDFVPTCLMPPRLFCKDVSGLM